MAIPQVANIWAGHDASGVSALTWGAYALTAFFWLLYGFLHNELIVVYAICLLLNFFIVPGILMYG